ETKRHRTLAPELFVADLEMRDLDRQSRLLADLNTFTNRVGYLVAFVAHVGCVKTTVSRGDACKRDDLVRLRISAGHVDPAGRKSDRTVFHGLIHHGFHLLLFFGSRRAISEAHHATTNRAVRNQRSKINCKRLDFDPSEKLCNVSG